LASCYAHFAVIRWVGADDENAPIAAIGANTWSCWIWPKAAVRC